MGAFNEAMRAMEDAERSCPRCHAQNKPHAKPTIDREQNGSFSCSQCGHNWKDKK